MPRCHEVVDVLSIKDGRLRQTRFLQLVAFPLKSGGELVDSALMGSSSSRGMNGCRQCIKKGAIPYVDLQRYTTTVGTKDGDKFRHVNTRHATRLGRFFKLVIRDAILGNSFPLGHHPVVGIFNMGARTNKSRVSNMALAGKRLTRSLSCRRL